MNVCLLTCFSYETTERISVRHIVVVLCSVDSASWYNRVKKDQLDAQPLSIFRQPLYVVLVGLEKSNKDNRQSSKKNNKHQLLYTYGCRAETECDGTWKRTGGEVKGKKANGGGSQQSCTVSDTVYPALLPLIRTPRLPAADWTDTPADINMNRIQDNVEANTGPKKKQSI